MVRAVVRIDGRWWRKKILVIVLRSLLGLSRYNNSNILPIARIIGT